MALAGLRILDMTQYEAGTSCTQALAWMGADVVKIESPSGDPGRGLRGAEGEKDREYFIVWNSNKRSVSLNLRSEEGKALLFRMLPEYDVFVENYGPQRMEKLGIGYEAMKAVKPDIIYARIKGFGMSGPWADYNCYDMVAQAAAGAFSITGEADGPPLRPGPTTGDSGSGVQMALAITAAYVQRMRTGEGQLIELSMQEAMTYFLRTALAGDGTFSYQPQARTGSGAPATMTLYPCAGGGPNDYMYIMAITPDMWADLCNAIGHPELIDDPRFARAAARLANAAELKPIIEEWTASRDKYEAMKILAEAGVPAGAVLDTSDLYENEHMVERGFVHEVEHAEHGRIKLLGWAPRMSASDVKIKPAPLLAQHTAEVLAEDLKLSPEELAAMNERGAILTRPKL